VQNLHHTGRLLHSATVDLTEPRPEGRLAGTGPRALQSAG
jgi:hypothetical protein